MAYRRSALMEERLASNRERILDATRVLIARGGLIWAETSGLTVINTVGIPRISISL